MGARADSSLSGAAVPGNPSKGGAAAAVAAMLDTSETSRALRHDPGLATVWTADEVAVLEELNAKYASDEAIVRCAKISRQLPDKTVRDVSLWCRMMTKKEHGKRRKDELARKTKDKKDRAIDPPPKPPAHLTAKPSVPSFAIPMLPGDTDDDIPLNAIGGLPGQLLQHNNQVLNQISANMANYQVQENIGLFCQTRDNILRILNEMNDMSEIMNQMPPLSVKVNEELANSILPRVTMPMQT